ncbi:cation transporter [Plesiomonas shigelloides]|nr:cation transporter [Plesiomonas shigelloides]
MPTTVLLALEGLKCMGCANKVKNTLLTLSNVTDVTATPQYAKVTGDAPWTNSSNKLTHWGIKR